MDDPFKSSQDIFEELIYGPDYVVKRKRAEELAHERELAAIRSEFHALPQNTANLPQTTIRAAPISRLSAQVDCPSAARKMEAYLAMKGIGQTQFAIQVQTTDRTLLRFRRSGKIRRDIFDRIAAAMNVSREDLLQE